MIQYKEKLELDIFDHDDNKLCNLYSNKSEMTGQAHNVIIMKQRNGWKELTFDQPGRIKGENGDEDNFRVKYIVADYKIRAIDDEGTDWYQMTEPQIKHVNGTKVLSAKAGHVCQLLKTKNLSLEFSDDEGNNTGTQEEQATTILDGTGWSVGDCDEFYEDYTDNAGNNIIKRRSLTASAKTGAFSQISKACELFRAKPTYHGDTKTVDFKPLNPFSEDRDGGVPEAITNEQVFELHYGHALKGVTRTLNTENLITRLYVQGAFKDKVSGYCGINEVSHKEYTFTFQPPSGQTGFPAGQEFKITFKDDIKKKNVRYFVCDEEITGNAKFVYSLRDPASMMFVLGTYATERQHGSAVSFGEVSNVVIRVTKESTTGNFVTTKKAQKRDKKSLMDSLMDFTYYDSVNLLSQEKLEKIAQYYIEAPGLLQIINEKMTDYSEAMQKLNETIGVVNYCRLDVTSTADDDGYTKFILGTDDHDQGKGVIYRTDYEAKANKRFKWRQATKLKSNGDPVDLTASVVYIIHPKQSGKPITWDKFYIKNIFNDNVIKQSGTWIKTSDTTVELNPNDGSEPITVTHDSQRSTASCSVTEDDQNVTLSPSAESVGSANFDFGGYTMYAYNSNKDLGCHVYVRAGGTYEISFDYNLKTKNAVIDQENISAITLWADSSEFSQGSNDKVFLFETYNLNGLLGQLETSDEATVLSLQAATKGITVNHPVYFEKGAVSTGDLSQEELDALHGYGWRWRYYPGDKTKGILYFCYTTENDTSWHRVWYSNGDLQPQNHVQNRDYWYNWAEKTLSRCYRAEGHNYGKWVLLESTEEKRIAEMFGTVYNACWTRDQYYKGIYDYTVYTVPENSTMPIGNYALYNGYHKYWLFTTQRNLVAGDTLTYDSKLDVVNERKPGTADKVLEVKSMRPDAAKYHSPNIAENVIWEDGMIYNAGEHAGEDQDSTEFERCGFIAVQPKTTYTVNYTPPSGENPVSLTILRYDENRKYIDDTQCGPGGTFNTNSTTRQETVEEETITVEVLTKYIRVTHAKQTIDNFKIQAVDFDQYLLVDDESYKIIGKDDDEVNVSYPDTVDEKENREKGIMKLIEKFKDQSYDVYEVCLPAVKAAQEDQNALEDDLKDTLGDLYREGFWEDDNYTDGDEHRLYVDGIDNLVELAKPEAKYNINYAHLRGSQVDDDYWSADFTKRGKWPRITIDSAAHLIDPELDINIWAFVDKVATCYDQPWKTNIEINTDQSTISQHSFSDVMTNIADVASKVKAKQSIYSRASNIGQGGVLDTNFLEGKINANKLLIEGGSSTWRTNARGNMIFENVDGGSAMTLTGNGFAIANSKDQDGDWNWRTFGTGEGFTADLITAGTLNAQNVNVTNLNADNINTGTLNGVLLRPGTVPSSKFDTNTKAKIDKIGDVSGLSDTMVNMVNQANQLSQAAQDIANSKNKTYIGSDVPSDTDLLTKGDTWIDTNNVMGNGANIVYRWDKANTQWIQLDDGKAQQALETATNAYTASSSKNSITYDENMPTSAKHGDIWVKTGSGGDTDGYHNMYVCVHTYQTDSNTKPDYYSPELALALWVLTSAGKTYGRRFDMDANTGEINITTDAEINIGSNGNQNLNSTGTGNNGGNVNIGANTAVNIASTGQINLQADSELNMSGRSVMVDGGTIDIQGGKVNVTGGQVNIASDYLDIASGGEDNDWSRNLILNSAANAMVYVKNTNQSDIRGQSSNNPGRATSTIDWPNSYWTDPGTNGTLTVGKAQDMIDSLGSSTSYTNTFKNRKNVFKLHRVSGSNDVGTRATYDIFTRISEPGEYTLQLRVFITAEQQAKLGSTTNGKRIQVLIQYRKTSSDANYTVPCSIVGQQSGTANAGVKILKAGWNKLKRTFTVTEDMINSYVSSLYILLRGGADVSDILFTNVKLERGASATGWTAAPEDDETNLKETWSEIRQHNGEIDLLTGGTNYIGNVVNSAVKQTPTEFNVEFNDKSAMKLTSTEANFSVDNVKIKGHLSADVVNTQKAWSFVVDDTNYPSNTTSALQSMINNLGKYLTGNITITINKKIYGNLTFSGFKSSGNIGIILIFGDQSSSVKGCLHGTLYVRYCDSFEIRGKAYGSTTTLPPQDSMADRSGICIAPIAKQRYCIWASGVKYFLSRGASYTIEKSKYGALTGVVRIDEGTHAYFYRNCFMGKYVTSGSGNALQSYGQHAVTAMASLDDCIGGTSTNTGDGRLTYAVVASNGSTVRIHGTHRPYGSYSQTSGFISGDTSGTATAWDVNDTYGTPYNPDANYIDQKYTDTEVTPASPYCFTQASTSSSIANTTASTMRTKKTDRIMCGKDTVDGETLYYFGVWIFSSRIATAQAGITSNNLVDAHLEQDVHPLAGVSGTRTISVYYMTTQITSAPSDNGLPSSYFNSSNKIKDISLTIGNDNEMWQVPTCNIPVNKLTDGAIKGFCIASTSNYTRFVNTGCKLVLTAKATDS